MSARSAISTASRSSGNRRPNGSFCDGGAAAGPADEPRLSCQSADAARSRAWGRCRRSPAATCSGCHSGRCGRTSSSRPSSPSSMSASTSFTFIRICSSSIAAWRSDSKAAGSPDGVTLAERVSAVGGLAHALAFCQAVERAAGCVVPPRALMLRSLLAELERLYNHLHYFGHLCNTTTLKVGEAEGKLLEERAKQINGKLTGSRFLRGLVKPGGLRRDLRSWVLAERVARGVARRIVEIPRQAGEQRQSPRPTDHDRRAQCPGGAGPRRDRTDRSRLRRRSRSSPRSPLRGVRRSAVDRAGQDERRRARPRASAHGGDRRRASRSMQQILLMLAGRADRVGMRSLAWRRKVSAGRNRRAARSSTPSISPPTGPWRASRSSRRRSRIGARFRSPCTTAT